MNFADLPLYVRRILLALDSLKEAAMLFVMLQAASVIVPIGWAGREIYDTWTNGEREPMNDDKVPVLLTKLAGVAALFGVSTWSEAAAAVSALLGGSILTRFYWRNVWRPFMEERGWLRRKRRRVTDKEESDWGNL